MSKAYKCDVCGKLFESRLVPFWIKSAIKPNETLDICDLCKAEFEHWLDPTKYEECEEDDRSCSKCIHSNCCPSDPLEDPCKCCDNYSNYVEDMRSCHTCMYGNCSPSEDPCVNCDNYSNYVNEKTKSCGNCVYLKCSIRNEPCSNCVRHADRPNYVDKKEVNLEEVGAALGYSVKIVNKKGGK